MSPTRAGKEGDSRVWDEAQSRGGGVSESRIGWVERSLGGPGGGAQGQACTPPGRQLDSGEGLRAREAAGALESVASPEPPCRTLLPSRYQRVPPTAQGLCLPVPQSAG